MFFLQVWSAIGSFGFLADLVEGTVGIITWKSLAQGTTPLATFVLGGDGVECVLAG